MKKIVKALSALLVVTVLFSSCGKDGKLRKDLEGTWKITSATDSTGSSITLTGIDIKYQFSACKKKDQPCDGVYTLTVTSLGLSATYNFTWAIDKEVITVTYTSSNPYDDNGTYNITFDSDTQVTITNSAHSQEKIVLTKI